MVDAVMENGAWTCGRVNDEVKRREWRVEDVTCGFEERGFWRREEA